MLRDPTLAQRHLTSPGTAITGATSIPPQLIKEIYDVLGFDEIYVPYGFTDGTGVATIIRRDDDRHVVATTVGRALPDIEVVVRRKDMYISGGFNVYPAEVEACLQEHPAVAAASVIGVADDRLGEVGYGFGFLDAPPMNASGKALKNYLAQLASDNPDAEAAS